MSLTKQVPSKLHLYYCVKIFGSVVEGRSEKLCNPGRAVFRCGPHRFVLRIFCRLADKHVVDSDFRIMLLPPHTGGVTAELAEAIVSTVRCGYSQRWVSRNLAVSRRQVRNVMTHFEVCKGIRPHSWGPRVPCRRGCGPATAIPR